MSIETAPTQKETRNGNIELASVFTLVLGSVIVFAGSLVLFAASPTMSVEPVFNVSPIEPVTVIANMALGASLMCVGAAVTIPQLDNVL